MESLLRLLQNQTFQSCYDVLLLMEDLQSDYRIEYYRYKLFQLFPSFIQPLLVKDFEGWNPLQVGLSLESLETHSREISFT